MGTLKLAARSTLSLASPNCAAWVCACVGVDAHHCAVCVGVYECALCVLVCTGVHCVCWYAQVCTACIGMHKCALCVWGGIHRCPRCVGMSSERGCAAGACCALGERPCCLFATNVALFQCFGLPAPCHTPSACCEASNPRSPWAPALPLPLPDPAHAGADAAAAPLSSYCIAPSRAPLHRSAAFPPTSARP